MAFSPHKQTFASKNPLMNNTNPDFMKANIGSQTPQMNNMAAPPQLNAAKAAATSSNLQQQGMAPAQAQASADNPSNTYNKLTMNKGGAIATPDKDATADSKKYEGTPDANFLASKLSDQMHKFNTKSEETKVASVPPHKPPVPDSASPHAMFGTNIGESEPDYYAKGGPVNGKHEAIKNLSLKDIIAMLASHHSMSGADAQPELRQGGAVPHVKKATVSPQFGASMNDDVGSYKRGGLVKMALGGNLEADSIVQYGPDGMPITQNQDGSQGEGDINALLGRPEDAPTLGTGALTDSATSSAANTLGGNTAQEESEQNVGNQPAMAKGGEAAPPGALQEEVADDVPAKLSEGEFVFSADAVRFFGLKTLTEMMEYARQELEKMNATGDIRHPGDGKNPDQQGLAGKFIQDQKPNTNAYSPDQKGMGNDLPSGGNEGLDDATGIIKECMGGQVGMAQGGFTGNYTGEEQFAKGGIVTATAPDMSLKKAGNEVPMTAIGAKSKGIKAPELPKINAKPMKAPKLKEGGLLSKKVC